MALCELRLGLDIWTWPLGQHDPSEVLTTETSLARGYSHARLKYIKHSSNKTLNLQRISLASTKQDERPYSLYQARTMIALVVVLTTCPDMNLTLAQRVVEH